MGYALMGLAPVAGFAAGSLLSPHLHAGISSLFLSAVASAQGYYTGTTMASWLASGPNDNARMAAGMITLSAGLAGTLALSAGWEPTASDVTLIGIGAFMGDLLGAGMPLFLSGSSAGEEVSGWSGLAGAIGGIGTGLLLKPLELRLSAGDAWIIGLGSLFLGTQAMGWGNLAHLEPQRAAGLSLLGYGIGLGSMLFTSQRLDLSAWQAAWVFSGAAWGAWLFGIGSFLAVGSTWENTLAGTLVGSNLGLMTTAVLISPLVGVDPSALAWASIGGVGGAAAGSLLAVFATGGGSGKIVAAVSLLGSGAGLVAGSSLWRNYGRPLKRATGAHASAGSISIPWPDQMAFLPLVPGEKGAEAGLSAQLAWTLR